MNREFTKLMIIEFIIVFIISLFLKDFFRSIKFTLAYFFLFYLPILVWTIKLKDQDLFVKFIITNLLGISIIPIIYSIIGYFTKLNTALFVLPSVLLIVIGLTLNKSIFNKIYKETSEDKEHGPADNNTGI